MLALTQYTHPHIVSVGDYVDVANQLLQLKVRRDKLLGRTVTTVSVSIGGSRGGWVGGWVGGGGGGAGGGGGRTHTGTNNT